MGQLKTFITPLHTNTKRDYLARMVDDKIDCMEVRRRYDKEFWDGDRRYGYGGYIYDGRWAKVAQMLIDQYDLTENSFILDVGCGKGFLLYELKKLLPGATVKGFDISDHALSNAKEEVMEDLFNHRAESRYPFEDNAFDLVISLTTLHNLTIQDLKTSLGEIERVGKNHYIVVESYRSEKELFNLQCWALTCESFFRPEEWCWLFDTFSYTGDYEFIYFE